MGRVEQDWVVVTAVVGLALSCASHPSDRRPSSPGAAPGASPTPSASVSPVPISPPSAAAPSETRAMPTLGELVAQLERFVGVEVRLEGVHVTILQTCTEKACGADNPCCNRCSEAAYIGVEPQLITLTRADGRPYAVRGTNCKLDGEIGLGAGPYSMLGRLESKADGLTFRAKSLVTEPAPGSP